MKPGSEYPLGPGPTTDPLIKGLTAKEVTAAVTEFRQLLDSKAREPKLQAFLEGHSYFFNRMLDPYIPRPIYSKVKLGHDWEVDFAWLYHDSFGPEWRFIEIENADTKLFTKGGNPTKELTHAVQQTRDWCDWVHHNLHYARSFLPAINYPLCYIFLGRRDELTGSNSERLKRFRYDHRKELEVHTLDWFVESAEIFGNSIGEKGPIWQIPMNVMKHRDLKKGIPEYASKWIKLGSDRMKEHRLDEREHRYYRNNEESVSPED